MHSKVVPNTRELHNTLGYLRHHWIGKHAHRFSRTLNCIVNSSLQSSMWLLYNCMVDRSREILMWLCTESARHKYDYFLALGLAWNIHTYTHIHIDWPHTLSTLSTHIEHRLNTHIEHIHWTHTHIAHTNWNYAQTWKASETGVMEYNVSLHTTQCCFSSKALNGFRMVR